ncbi:MAG: CBS domain-containing protein [Planctomycetes bacterium]|nr:CBS domain-containing protein [Planctomycetota bacterium]
MPALEGLLLIGILLAGGVVGGWFARLLRLPTLTGYLAAGIGIHLLATKGYLQHESLEELRHPVNNLAMALALFILGGQFKLKGRGGGPTGMRSLLKVSALESAFTFAIVFGLSMAVLGDLQGAILLAILAIAVAPATTLEVLHEYEAKGSATRKIKQLTALSNVWAVFLFELALVLFFAFEGGDSSFTAPIWDVLGSLVYGLIAGHALILMQERVGRDNYAVPLLAVILLTIGVCEMTDVPHMLAFLVTGAVVVNRSQLFPRITAAMNVYAQPAIVLFFVLSGSHLDFGKLSSHWLAVGLYVLGRTLGKSLGAHFGLYGINAASPTRQGENPPIGLALLCQAGAAIALASYVESFNEELADDLLNIILGAVVVFELLGPILVKKVAVAAGEVSLGNLMSHTADREGRRGWRAAVRATFGGHRVGKGQDPATVTVERFMRPNATALRRSANMDVILRFANSSPFNHFPVIDPKDQLVGVVTLADLSQIAYDKRTAALVTAEDIATLSVEEAALTASTTLPEALEFFKQFDGNTAAVISSLEAPVLIGMVERSEVLHLARRMEGAP